MQQPNSDTVTPVSSPANPVVGAAPSTEVTK
jgi:hypothetical protein